MDKAKVDSSVNSQQIIQEEGGDNQQNSYDLDSEEDFFTTSTPNQALQNEQEEENMDKSNADINSMVQQGGNSLNEFHTPKDQIATEEMSTVDRSMDSTLLATNAADKRADYYGGKLKWIGETRPVKKTISTYNRFRGSGEPSDQTLDHLSNALYSADFGFSYLFWRIIFGLKDFVCNTYAIAQRKGLTRPPVIALGIVLFPIVMTVMSPLLIGLSFVIVPIFIFAFFFLAIPSMFLMPSALFFIYMFGGMPKLLSILDRFLNIFFGNRRDGNGEGTNRISDGDGGRIGTSGS